MRRFSLEAIDTALQRLRVGRDSAATREQLVQEFNALLAASREAGSREERWARGEVFDTVLENLRESKGADGTVVPAEEVVRVVMDNLVDLQQRLATSPPSSEASVSK